jgi:hypothetical protein
MFSFCVNTLHALPITLQITSYLSPTSYPHLLHTILQSSQTDSTISYSELQCITLLHGMCMTQYKHRNKLMTVATTFQIYFSGFIHCKDYSYSVCDPDVTYGALTFALDGKGIIFPGLPLYHRERASSTHWAGGFMGPRAGLDTLKKIKNPCPWREFNHNSSTAQSVA